MWRLFQKRASGPELSPETLRRVNILFPPEDRERANALLYEQCGSNLPFLEKADMYELERFRFAALKYSDGNLIQLERAVNLGQQDWRDLLMATGFANDVEAHRSWEPKPAGEPAEIDPLLLVSTVHDRLATVLVPLGFERQGDEWRREGEVPQTLRLQTGLTSRTQAKFFLQATLEAKPIGVILHLPRLPAGLEKLSSEQGYVFRAGDSEEALYVAVLKDVVLYSQSWFQRFTSNSEVRRGFEDGTFATHLRVEDRALIF
jgi:hypothetical protein